MASRARSSGDLVTFCSSIVPLTLPISFHRSLYRESISRRLALDAVAVVFNGNRDLGFDSPHARDGADPGKTTSSTDDSLLDGTAVEDAVLGYHNSAAHHPYLSSLLAFDILKLSTGFTGGEQA